MLAPQTSSCYSRILANEHGSALASDLLDFQHVAIQVK